MTKTNWRKVIRQVPLVAAIIGMAFIFGSIVFFFHDDYQRIAAVAAGLLVLLLGIWYAANPFLKNQRQYLPLRAEVDRFMDLVRELDHATTADGPTDEIERTKSEMHHSVERMGDLAGKEGKPPVL